MKGNTSEGGSFKGWNELTGFFAMSPEIQGLFEKCANDVRISLEQWFEHRMSNNETLRRQHQWRVFSSVLNLRADLERQVVSDFIQRRGPEVGEREREDR